jgi:hypothetical protein
MEKIANLKTTKKKINSDRKRDLINSNRFDMSAISNILELNNCIEFEIFDKIDKTRTLRNRVVHPNKNVEISCDDAEMSIHLASKLLYKKLVLN